MKKWLRYLRLKTEKTKSFILTAKCKKHLLDFIEFFQEQIIEMFV